MFEKDEEEIIIKNAKVFDFFSNISGEKLDLSISRGKFVNKCTAPEKSKLIDANGLIAVPGAIELSANLCKPEVSNARSMFYHSKFSERSISKNRISSSIFPSIYESQRNFLISGITTICEPDILITQSKITHKNLQNLKFLDKVMMLNLSSNSSIFGEIQSDIASEKIGLYFSKFLLDSKSGGVCLTAPFGKLIWDIRKKISGLHHNIPILNKKMDFIYRKLIEAIISLKTQSKLIIDQIPDDFENLSDIMKKNQENLHISDILSNTAEHSIDDLIEIITHYSNDASESGIESKSENKGGSSLISDAKFSFNIIPIVLGTIRPLITRDRNKIFKIKAENEEYNFPINLVDMEFDSEYFVTMQNFREMNETNLKAWANPLYLLLELKKIHNSFLKSQDITRKNLIDRVCLAMNAPYNMSIIDRSKIYAWLLNKESRFSEYERITKNVGMKFQHPIAECETELSLLDIVQISCYNPAKVLGLEKEKGSISEGFDADILLYDLDMEIISAGDKNLYAYITKQMSDPIYIIKNGIIIKNHENYLDIENNKWTNNVECWGNCRNINHVNYQNLSKLYIDHGKYSIEELNSNFTKKEKFFDKYFSQFYSQLINKSE